MRTKKTMIGVLIGLIIVMAVLAILNKSSVPKYDNKLNMKMDCAFDNVDLFEVINPAYDISRELAMGVEVNFSFMESQNGKSRRFSLNVSSMTRREILDEIVRQNPGYYWKERDGVINIQPYREDNDKNISPLDMTIPCFEVHQIPPYFALEYLTRLSREHNIPIISDFYEMAIQLGHKLPDSSGKLEHPENYDPRRLIDVVIPHKVSIRDCLNAIVLADPPANWEAIKWKGGKTRLSIRSSQSGYSREKNLDMPNSY
ncbi:MAG: hypothetical protein HY796_02890 [Elusimicrobia bacterium]|nr:hypothetical protein [Elusimicrobiota bacterium]